MLVESLIMINKNDLECLQIIIKNIFIKKKNL